MALDMDVPGVLVSVRGHADVIVPPDGARTTAHVVANAAEREQALAQAGEQLAGLRAGLAGLGGEALRAENTESRLTWSASRLQVHERHHWDAVSQRDIGGGGRRASR